MNNVETEFERDAYGNLYGAHEPVMFKGVTLDIEAGYVLMSDGSLEPVGPSVDW